MQRYRLLALFLSLATLPLGAQAIRFVARQKVAGVIDLAGIPQGDYTELSGKWDFWPNRFVDPMAAADGGAPFEVAVPSHWDDLGVPGLISTGYATYHLDVEGVPLGGILGLKLTGPLSATKVFVDGVEVLAMGRPAEDARDERPRWDSQVVALNPRGRSRLDLVIQISNHVDFSGGIIRPILFGDYKAVDAARTAQVTPEMFAVGALVIIGFYCIMLFGFRPRENHALYFGLLAFILAVRALFYDEFLILSLIPQLPFEVLFRVGYLTFSVPFVLVAGFFRHIFPRYFPFWEFALVAVFSALYSLFIVFAPMHDVAMTLFDTEAFAILFGFSSILTLGRALAARHNGSILLSAGFLMFFLPVVHDILVNNGVLHDPYLLPFGMILFFATLAVLITRTSTQAMRSRKVIMVEREKPKLLLSEKGLSATEIAYSTALLSGRSVKEIAFEYDVSESTVRNSLSRAYAKIEVPSMAAFLSLASKYEVLP